MKTFGPPLSLVGNVAAIAAVVAFSGCGREEKAAPNPKVVAVVAGAEIPAEALVRELAARTKGGVQAAPTLDRKLEVLEALVRDEALFAKAKAAHFEESPEMRAEIRRMIVSRFREKEFAPRDTAPSAAEVAAFYRENAVKYALPASVRGAMIFLPSPATATADKRAEARARAESVLTEARSTQAFAQVVARHSADQATRYRGGELPWVTHDSQEVDAAVTKALFALQTPGEFAPLVETPRGFYIAKLLERREPGTKPLAQVEEGIRYELSRRNAAQSELDFYGAMKRGLDIQIHRDAVEALTLPAEKESAPPSMPGAVGAR